METNEKATALRSEYEKRLHGHSEIVGLRAGSADPTKAQAVPRLVTTAMRDEVFARVITVARQKNRYESDIDELARRRLAKQAVPLDSQTRIIQEGDQIERGLRDAIGATFRRARFDASTKAYASAVADNPVPREIVDDFPAHMTRDEQEALSYVGWGPDHSMWRELPRHLGNATGTTPDEAVRRTADRLKHLEDGAGRLDYSRAPRHLVKEHILTLSGGDWLQDLIVFLVFLLIFVNWLFHQIIQTLEAAVWDLVRGSFGM